MENIFLICQNNCLRLIFLLYLCLVQIPAFAIDSGVIENYDLSQQDALIQDISGGVVVDHTITFIAHEFYQYFVKFWHNQPASQTSDLTIYERPTARWGSIVWVEHNNQIVFRANLFSARSKTESIAESAAKAISQQLEDIAIQESIFSDPDIDSESY